MALGIDYFVNGVKGPTPRKYLGLMACIILTCVYHHLWDQDEWFLLEYWNDSIQSIGVYM